MNTNAQAQAEQTTDYDITFFAVSNTTKVESCTYTDFISPYFETAEQARDFKAQSLEEYPECFVGKYEAYYDSEDDRGRLELLAKIVSAHQSLIPAILRRQKTTVKLV